MIRIHDRLKCSRARADRYRRLLATDLTEIERRYVERRLSEEEAAMRAMIPAAGPPAIPWRRAHQAAFASE